MSLQALATFHFILMDVVTEKDEKRRLGLRHVLYPPSSLFNRSLCLLLRMMGMGVTAFLAAWAVATVVLSALSATMVVVAGRIAQFTVRGCVVWGL